MIRGHQRTQTDRKAVRRALASAWLKDSGATWHSTNDRRVFKHLRRPTRRYIIRYGNGRTEVAQGIGECHIPVIDEKGEQQTLVLDHVLYLPGSSGSVFSSSYFIGKPGERTGNEHWGGSNGEFIKAKGKTAIRCDEDVQALSAYIMPVNDSRAVAGQVIQQVKCDKTDLRYWHAIFGHRDHRAIMRMHKKGMVRGMPKALRDEQIELCPICTACKMKRTSVKSGKRERAKRKFEKVSTDLVEMNVRTREGNYKYAAIYVDHHTRMKWVFGLKKKSDTYKTLRLFLDRVVYPEKLELGTIYSDNGGEYTGSDWAEVVTAARCKHRFSAPRTAAQNGMAERAVGSLTSMAKCLLKDASKPKSWWLWALTAAAYISNRTDTAGLEHDMTPYEVFHGKKPNTKHMKKWGSDMWVHIYDHERRKLDDRAKKVSFIK